MEIVASPTAETSKGRRQLPEGLERNKAGLVAGRAITIDETSTSAEIKPDLVKSMYVHNFRARMSLMPVQIKSRLQ